MEHLKPVSEAISALESELGWASIRVLQRAFTQYLELEGSEVNVGNTDNKWAVSVTVKEEKAYFPDDRSVNEVHVGEAVIRPRIRTIHYISGGCKHGSSVAGYIKPTPHLRGMGGPKPYPFFIRVNSSGGHWVKAEMKKGESVVFTTDFIHSEISWGDHLSGAEAAEVRAKRLVDAAEVEAEVSISQAAKDLRGVESLQELDKER